MMVALAIAMWRMAMYKNNMLPNPAKHRRTIAPMAFCSNRRLVL